MDDRQIVQLYFDRSERAIFETREKYGRLLFSVAYNILSSEGDSEECVDDTYMRAWQVIPPSKPNFLSAFLSKITRNLALNRYRQNKRRIRSLGADLIFEEISECVPATQGDVANDIELRDALNSFVMTLGAQNRLIFLKRYFYMCSVKDIAREMSMSQSAVKVALMRTRNKLREHLERAGISL